jgi:hypothetical protein
MTFEIIINNLKNDFYLVKIATKNVPDDTIRRICNQAA